MRKWLYLSGLLRDSSAVKKPVTMLIAGFAATGLLAADLPTVTIEHLYYLQARAERIGKLKPEQMIDYCIAQKLGSSSFESLYTQTFSMRVDMTKLLKVQEVLLSDPRIVTLTRTIEAYNVLLYDEAKRVQNGIMREGEVATDALTAIARAQQQQ